MIEWWWLVVEAFVIVGWCAINRGIARKAALLDALCDPASAEAEVRRRFGWSAAQFGQYVAATRLARQAKRA